MRELKIIEHMSLDGVIQHSADGDDFPYGEWTVPYRTPEGRQVMLAAHGECFDLLLGRRLYDSWSAFWPQAPSSPMADRLNAATKFVVTHRPESLTWGPWEALGPDVAEGVRRIKAQDGPVTRARQHRGDVVRCHPQHVHARGTVERGMTTAWPWAESSDVARVRLGGWGRQEPC